MFVLHGAVAGALTESQRKRSPVRSRHLENERQRSRHLENKHQRRLLAAFEPWLGEVFKTNLESLGFPNPGSTRLQARTRSASPEEIGGSISMIHLA